MPPSHPVEATTPPPPAAAPAPPNQFGALLAHAWHAFHPGPALYCLPAVVALLAVGVAAGQNAAAMLAAAGAFSVGFGAFQRFTRLHVAPMLLAAVGMAFSTGVGTLASNHPAAEAAVVGLAALVLGLAASLGTGFWWAMLQGAIFLVVATSRPGDVGDAVNRAFLVLGGGLVQCATVACLKALAPGGFPPLEPPNALPSPDSLAGWRRALAEILRPGSPELGYGVLLGLAAAAGDLLARRIGLANGYWIPMTVLLVLRRGGSETVTRAILRMGGTVIGATAATLIAAVLRPAPPTLIFLVALAAWSSYAVQWVNYGTFSVSVTSYIAFLFALEGLPEPAVASHRVTATVLGGLLALGGIGLAKLLRLAARPLAA